jgi:addiction module HigA family antidote
MNGKPLMSIYNPPHPGELIREVYLEPFGLSARQLAAKLDVSPSTLSRLLNENAGVSPEMALRLSKSLGRTAESWLTMQDAYDLWNARQVVDLETVERVRFHAAGRTSPRVPRSSYTGSQLGWSCKPAEPDWLCSKRSETPDATMRALTLHSSLTRDKRLIALMGRMGIGLAADCAYLSRVRFPHAQTQKTRAKPLP